MSLHRNFRVKLSLIARNRNEPAKLASNTSLQYSKGVDQRLSRVEKALETLSETINTSLNKNADSQAPSLAIKSHHEPPTSYKPPAEALNSPELTLDDSHSFAYLGEASRHLESIKSHTSHEQLAEHQAASTALQDLSEALTTINLQPPFNDVASFEFIDGYSIPSKPIGYRLISCMSALFSHGVLDEKANYIRLSPKRTAC
jgi:hypothetical protein